MLKVLRGFLAWWAIILVGVGLVWFTRSSGGIRIQDVQFVSAGGRTLSALLVITQEARSVGKLQHIQTLCVELFEQSRATLHMIEDAEPHRA